MRKYILGLATLASIAFSLTITGWKSTQQTTNVQTAPVALTADSMYHIKVNNLYHQLRLNNTALSLPVFEKAVTGFYNLKHNGALSNKSILTIVNFDQVSTEKRMYIIDLDKKEVLLNTWVAHGQRSGDNTTTRFSNINNSFSSSLGFYVTGEIYSGVHGRSLKLDGLDQGFNDNARSRSIVVHGAAYVSEGTINALGRLGRSQGCPAVAPEVADKVINTIENKTVLFINKSDEHYSSKYLNETLAANFSLGENSTAQMD